MLRKMPPLTFDLASLDVRLNASVTRGELIATMIALSVLGASTWYHQTFDHIPYDFWTYFITEGGDLSVYYYAHWSLPFFGLLGKLPFFWGYFLLGVLNIFGIFLAARIFGGNTVFVLLSFQTLYTLYFGNLIGLIVGSLALFWWCLAHKRWILAGILLCIAATKYQLGITSGLFVLLLADVSWKKRGRVLIATTGIFLLSLIVYPGWPIESFQTISNNPPNELGSLSLWRWIGATALLFWIPPLVLSMSPKRRIIMLSATSTFALPYFQQTDLLFLFSFPVGWPVLLGNLGYLFFLFRWEALPVIVIAPLLIYFAEIIPLLRARYFAPNQ